MCEALESWHFGQVLYAYRTHPHHGRALSQGAVADWLGVTQAQLSRIENGSAPQDLSKLMQWAHSLKIPADLLWFKLPGSGHQFAAPANPRQESDHQRPEEPPETRGSALLPVMVNGQPVFVPVDAETLATSGLGSLSALPADSTTATEYEAMSPLHRRTLLSGIAAAALPGCGLEELQRVATALEDSRRYQGGPVVDYFRTQLDYAKRDDGSLGPKKTLPVVLGLLGAIEQHARDVKPKSRRELLSVGADGAEFAGWLWRDLHQPGQAGFWYDRAMEWAQEADDAAMQGYVLLKKSQMAYDERDALRVLTLAQAGSHDRWCLPARVRAEVTQQEALGLAMTGEPLDAVKQKLDEAHGLLTAVPDDDAPTLGAYFTEDTLMLRNAITFTEAGKPSLAVELFGDAIGAGTLSRRDTGFFNARRAAAVALCGEPDEAAQLGRQSAEVAHTMKSERTLRVLSEVLHTLGRWSGRPAVRDFREALRAS
ncbi:transcriptional regulator [Streptomyces pluripotens]|uniref:Transcriptional regulator n=1 Tax=Streptomyces pluripotens TaxID=1355015 RepID=A0A221NU88_9ACTN|nr:helix-turn-helix transcriptional regulator [Streptomyces pluripotens]ARP69315.1 transcriptional regulator [Streptomyces pluripotens]ASN23573.1 transcriptional regulator [Streptomyces pluripotens]